jgi:hypothetical protein
MIDAYHASEATPFARFDPRQRVLEQESHARAQPRGGARLPDKVQDPVCQVA